MHTLNVIYMESTHPQADIFRKTNEELMRDADADPKKHNVKITCIRNGFSYNVGKTGGKR